jgi:hypothetical protein
MLHCVNVSIALSLGVSYGSYATMYRQGTVPRAKLAHMRRYRGKFFLCCDNVYAHVNNFVAILISTVNGDEWSVFPSVRDFLKSIAYVVGWASEPNRCDCEK